MLVLDNSILQCGLKFPSITAVALASLISDVDLNTYICWDSVTGIRTPAGD